jgi:hypothetical protein
VCACVHQQYGLVCALGQYRTTRQQYGLACAWSRAAAGSHEKLIEAGKTKEKRKSRAELAQSRRSRRRRRRRSSRAKSDCFIRSTVGSALLMSRPALHTSGAVAWSARATMRDMDSTAEARRRRDQSGSHPDHQSIDAPRAHHQARPGLALWGLSTGVEAFRKCHAVLLARRRVDDAPVG